MSSLLINFIQNTIKLKNNENNEIEEQIDYKTFTDENKKTFFTKIIYNILNENSNNDNLIFIEENSLFNKSLKNDISIMKDMSIPNIENSKNFMNIFIIKNFNRVVCFIYISKNFNHPKINMIGIEKENTKMLVFKQYDNDLYEEYFSNSKNKIYYKVAINRSLCKTPVTYYEPCTDTKIYTYGLYGSTILIFILLGIIFYNNINRECKNVEKY